MAARSFNGITMLEQSTTNTSFTEVTNIVANESGVEFADSDNEDLTYYGGRYDGPQARTYTVTFIDRTVYDTMRTSTTALTGLFFRWTLDNGETHVTTLAVHPDHLGPVGVEGQKTGRGDKFKLIVTLTEDEITETTA